MGNDWILAKTAAGVEEIATRARRVPPRLRTVLILVDGRRSVADLVRSAAGLGDVHQALESLHDDGFVFRVGFTGHRAELASRASVRHEARAETRVTTPPPAHPRSVPGQRRSLALARLYLLNTMEQSLRFGDLPVRERLRSATSRAELLLAFALCMEIASEVGVGHVDVIERNFFGMLPDED